MGRHSADRGAGTGSGSGSRGLRPLEGARVLITRSPDRAEGLALALRELGAEPLLLPLIDFERAADQHSLDVAFDALGAGAYQWLVISSSTAVRALEIKARERGTTLRQWLPESVRVATVGSSSREVLAASGLEADLWPEDEQSAAGLTAVWPYNQGMVLLPQADLADPRLAAGLQARGATVQAVTAYHTVDYPADPARSLEAGSEIPAQMPPHTAPAVLTTAMVKTELEAGRLHAVVAASPSAVQRIHARLLPLGGCRVVAIGASTAAQADLLGLGVAATAQEPTVEGLVDAVVRALTSDSAGGLPAETDSAASDHP